MYTDAVFRSPFKEKCLGAVGNKFFSRKDSNQAAAAEEARKVSRKIARKKSVSIARAASGPSLWAREGRVGP